MIIPTQAWVYRAQCVRVVDGDTLDLKIDAGFHATYAQRVRLLGVNAPEMHGASKDAGEASKAWVQDWIVRANDGEWPLTIQTQKTDHFSRWLATVWRTSTGDELNGGLIAAGMAVPYMVEGA